MRRANLTKSSGFTPLNAESSGSRSRNLTGFTLIELLVVVFIIGIVATIVTIAFSAIRARARDVQRVTDARAVQAALELYNNREGTYLDTTDFVPGRPIIGPTSGATFLRSIPANPTPRTDGGCADTGYSYYYDSATGYRLFYCLGGAQGASVAGINVISPSGIGGCQANCTGKCSGDADGCGGTCSNSCAWSAVQTGKPDSLQANYNSLFVYNYVPYVAFAPGAAGNGVYVVKTENGVTSLVGGVAAQSTGADYFTSLYIYNGTPYVAYQDGADYKLYVKKFNGSSWETVGGGAASLGMAGHISLFVYNGRPYVAFRDYNTGVGEELTVRYYDGSAWQTVGTAGVSDGLKPASTSMYINHDGTIYVSFANYPSFAPGDGNSVYVMKYNGSWSYVGTTVYSGAVGYGATSLSVYNDLPYVAYCYGNCNYGASGGEIGVKYWTGSAWAYPGGSVSYPCDNVTHYISLSISNNGTIYVFFPDYTANTAYVKKWTGSTWATVGGTITTGASWYHSIFLYNDIPFIAYRDTAATGYELTVKKYQ